MGLFGKSPETREIETRQQSLARLRQARNDLRSVTDLDTVEEAQDRIHTLIVDQQRARGVKINDLRNSPAWKKFDRTLQECFAGRNGCRMPPDVVAQNFKNEYFIAVTGKILDGIGGRRFTATISEADAEGIVYDVLKPGGRLGPGTFFDWLQVAHPHEAALWHESEGNINNFYNQIHDVQDRIRVLPTADQTFFANHVNPLVDHMNPLIRQDLIAHHDEIKTLYENLMRIKDNVDWRVEDQNIANWDTTHQSEPNYIDQNPFRQQRLARVVRYPEPLPAPLPVPPPPETDAQREARERERTEREMIDPRHKNEIIDGLTDVITQEYTGKLATDIDEEERRKVDPLLRDFAEYYYYRGLTQNWTVRETQEYLRRDVAEKYDEGTNEGVPRELYNFLKFTVYASLRDSIRGEPRFHSERHNPYLDPNKIGDPRLSRNLQNRSIDRHNLYTLRRTLLQFQRGFYDTFVNNIPATDFNGGSTRYIGMHDIPVIGTTKIGRFLSGVVGLDRLQIPAPWRDRIAIEDTHEISIPFQTELLAMRIACAGVEKALGAPQDANVRNRFSAPKARQQLARYYYNYLANQYRSTLTSGRQNTFKSQINNERHSTVTNWWQKLQRRILRGVPGWGRLRSYQTELPD